MRLLPKLVGQLVTSHNGFIIGSAADPSCDFKELRDWDVVIPYENWCVAAQIIPKNAVPNTFGGWKCVSEVGCIGETISIDVWPDDLSTLLTNHHCPYIWHPRSNSRWIRWK